VWALYLYPDGSVTNTPKVGVEPTATIEPHARWSAADDHGLGEQMRKALGPGHDHIDMPAAAFGANQPFGLGHGHFGAVPAISVGSGST